MRIALLVPTLEIGGVERVFANLTNGLHDQGVDVDLLAGKAGGEMATGLHPNVRVLDLRSNRMLMSVPRLTEYLRAEHPDALIAAMTQCTAAALLARGFVRDNVKVIATEHNSMSKVIANGRGLKYRLMPTWGRWALNSADHIVAVSSGVADDISLRTGIQRSRFHVIYNPVVSSGLYAAAQDPVHHPWFQAGQPPVVLAVGRLDKQKDFPMLLRAFRLVKDSTAARLLILGEGPDRSRIENTVRELGMENDVALPGFERNPYRFMRRSAVFALSSAWEGFGVVLVEALAIGLPVVSTNCTYGPSEILENGKHGTLVPVGDHEAMARGLLQAIRNPPRSNANHVQQFTIASVAAEYLRLIRS
jgi:glycosyltransferase involved in cell wall biosynthesis